MTGKSGAIRAGRAYVEAFLDSSALDKGLKNAQAKLNGFAKQVGAIGGQLVAMGTAVLASLAAGVKMFTSYGDQIAKMSRRTGVGVEALSALEHAASLSGSSIESLERSLVAMAKFMHIAASGSKESVDVLEDLGVTLDELQTLSPEQRFLKLADSLSKIDDPTRRAGLAMKVFGKSGTELIPLLEHGAAGIDELMRHAEELGLVLNQEDAAAAEVMNDAMDDLSKSVRSVFFALGRELLPVAKDLVTWLTAQVPAIREWIAENRELITTLAKLAGITVLVGSGLLAIAGAAKVGAIAIGTLTAAKTLLIGKLGTLAALLPMAFAVAGIALFVSQVAQALVSVDNLNARLRESAKLNRELAALFQKRRGATVEQLQGIEDPAARGQAAEDEIKRQKAEVDGLNAQLERQRQIVAELAPTWRSLWQIASKEWLQEKQALQDTERRLEAQKQHIKELESLRQQAATEEKQREERRTEEQEAGISRVLEKLREELDTFGLDSAQRAIRELENLNASEEELAEARKLSAEMAAKEAEGKAREEQEREAERAKAEAERATQQIADVLQQLADEVSDLQIKDPTDRAVERQLRDLRRLGATDDQLMRAADLVRQKEGELTGPEGLGERSFTAQGGTFSSLASLAFGSGEGDALKSIEQHTADTAKHTKKMSRSSGMTFGA